MQRRAYQIKVRCTVFGTVLYLGCRHKANRRSDEPHAIKIPKILFVAQGGFFRFILLVVACIQRLN